MRCCVSRAGTGGDARGERTYKKDAGGAATREQEIDLGWDR